MTRPLTLRDHMESAGRTVKAIREESGKDLHPMMHMVMPNGQVNIASLVVEGAGDAVAYAGRICALRFKPEHAILIWEGWTHRKDLDPNDRDFRALQAGMLRPSQLPPHKRGEMVILLGESADGSEEDLFLYIEPDGTLTEHMASWNQKPSALPGERGMVTHMRPIMVDRYMLRSMGAEGLQELTELLGSQEKVFHAANHAALRFVEAAGPGLEPQGYTQRLDELTRQMRERIGWRKGGKPRP